MKQNSPSFTAFIVALTQVSLADTLRWRGLIKDNNTRFYRIFVHECLRYGLAFRIASWLPASWRIWILDQLIVRGMPQGLVMRKALIEKKTCEAISGGITQVVNIGAGFDTLMLRLAAVNQQVRFYELDHPATQSVKRDALEQHEIQLSKNCTFISCDLSQSSLEQVLRTSSFDPSLPTFYIMEGLTMYLTPKEVTALFTSIRQLTGTHSEVMFGALGALGQKGNPGDSLMKFVLCLRREPYKWSMDPTLMTDFLGNLGFSLRQYVSYPEIQQSILAQDRFMQLQHVNGEHYYLATCKG